MRGASAPKAPPLDTPLEKNKYPQLEPLLGGKRRRFLNLRFKSVVTTHKPYFIKENRLNTPLHKNFFSGGVITGFLQFALYAVDITEIAQSHTWGIFIQDTAYSIVIQWSIRSYFRVFPPFWTASRGSFPENLKNLNTFLCQIWLLLSSKVPFKKAVFPA